jgi:hypothetical protein
MRFVLIAILSLFVTCTTSLPLLAQDGEKVLIHEDFQPKPNEDKINEDFLKTHKHSGNVSIAFVGEQHYLKLMDTNARVSMDLALEAGLEQLTITCQFKTTDVVNGKEGWQDARMAIRFVNDQYKRVGDWPAIKIRGRGTKDWQTVTQTLDIPRDATRVLIEPAMFGQSGSCSFDDIIIKQHHPRQVSTGDLPLPDLAIKPWDNANAFQAHSQTQSQICLNDLWQFYPVFQGESETLTQQPPVANSGWGYFKVPGIWPPANRAQGFFFAPKIQAKLNAGQYKLSQLDQAWYHRPIQIPANWQDRRIELDLTSVQTHAHVWIDDKPAGEILWPGGKLDLTDYVIVGHTHQLAIFVSAKPLTAETAAWAAPDTIAKRKAVIQNKGLVGDVFLNSMPTQNQITDVLIMPSVRNKALAMRVALDQLTVKQLKLQADVFDGKNWVKTITSDLLDATGSITFSGQWLDPKLWDLHTPQNVYQLKLSLLDDMGKLLNQTLPITFGFREFWIDGKDFMLNGSPVHLRAMDVRNNVSPAADQASDDICEVTCKRAIEYGYNMFITHNYGYMPGQTGYADALYRSTDRNGILISYSLPHVGHFGWNLDDKPTYQRYQQLTDYLIKRVQNHPSVVMYAMNHNATSYKGAQNPQKLDGVYNYDHLSNTDPDRMHRRLQAEGFAANCARQIDPSRPVYHHSSGHLGQMVTLNCYLNWAEPQERSDWIGPWAQNGKKPLFFVEFGMPHHANWSSFRGPGFIHSTPAHQWVRDAEYAASFLGQQAYQRDDEQAQLLENRIKIINTQDKIDWMKLVKPALLTQWPNYHQVQALFSESMIKDYRAQGLSGLLPWDHEYFWHRVTDKRTSKPWPNAMGNLQQPGIVPDTMNAGWFYFYEPDDTLYEDTAMSATLKKWFQPVIAFIAGPEDRVTDKAANYQIGELVKKQLIIVNDRREAITVKACWKAGDKPAIHCKESLTVGPGQIAAMPIEFKVPDIWQQNTLDIEAKIELADGTTLHDHMTLNVLKSNEPVRIKSRIALYDPVGNSAKTLEKQGISFDRFKSPDALPEASDIARQYQLLIVGRHAMTETGYLSQIAAVKNGLNVLFLEQSVEALTQGMGLRADELNLRTLWNRSNRHPVMEGITDAMLCNWQGDATAHEPFTPNLSAIEQEYQPGRPWYGNGKAHSRPWRAGNRGTVASVLIEKPMTGHFLPLIDGGFNLQYSPLLVEQRGKGRVIYCQLDVTARTQSDPVATKLVNNMLQWLDQPIQTNNPTVYMLGNDATQQMLKQWKIAFEQYQGQSLENVLLVVGHGADRKAVATLPKQMMAIGLNADEVAAWSDGKLAATEQALLSLPLVATDEPILAGINSAELHWQSKPTFAAIAGDGHPALRVLRNNEKTWVFCQVTPELLSDPNRPELRCSFRRTSYMINRLLMNMGAKSDAGIEHWLTQNKSANLNWLEGVYVQEPIDVDDPYRFYGW